MIRDQISQRKNGKRKRSTDLVVKAERLRETPHRGIATQDLISKRHDFTIGGTRNLKVFV
jgi:hypothetical protein